MIRRMVGAIALTTILATGLAAQTWKGAEAIALQVKDSKGRPIAGARVVLTFQGIPGETGPGIVATDSQGRAVLDDLAPGPWQVEVAHPEYLSYIAMIDVRRGKKPLVSASFLEAGGRSLEPVKVKVSRGEKLTPSPVIEARAAAPSPPAEAPVAKEPVAGTVVAEEPPAETPVAEIAVAEEPPARAPVEAAPVTDTQAVASAAPKEAPETTPEPSTPAPPLPTPIPPAQTRSEEAEPVATAPPVQEPATAPEAKPDSTATPATGTVSVPEVPQPSVETQAPPEQPIQAEPEPEIPSEPPVVPQQPGSEVVAAPPVAKPPASEPASELAPEPVPVPTPAPRASTVGVPPPPRPAPYVTSHSAGTCPDCGSAEWTLTVSIPAPAAAPGASASCSVDLMSQAQPAMAGLSTSIQLELNAFIGSVADESGHAAVDLAEPDLAAPFTGVLAPYVEGTSPCQIIGLVLPKGVRFSRVSYSASDTAHGGTCSPGQPCTIGEAQWIGSARVERGPSATVVYALFENRSTERGRLASLTAYYRPPNASWQPRLRETD